MKHYNQLMIQDTFDIDLELLHLPLHSSIGESFLVMTEILPAPDVTSDTKKSPYLLVWEITNVFSTFKMKKKV